MNYEIFEVILTKRIVVTIIVCVVAMIFGVCFTIYSIRTRRTHNDYPLFLIMSLIVIGCAIILGSHIYAYAYDIINQAYIVYEGDYLRPDIDHRTHTLYIYENGDEINLEIPETMVTRDARYSGKAKIIYAQKSKLVLDIYYYYE